MRRAGAHGEPARRQGAAGCRRLLSLRALADARLSAGPGRRGAAGKPGAGSGRRFSRRLPGRIVGRRSGRRQGARSALGWILADARELSECRARQWARAAAPFPGGAMTEAHLLLVALGPVQDFIAQARRSRDLWFGSHLLSELSRAAAARLATAGARLIFPALAACDPELAPCDAPTRPDGAPPISIANKILAEVPAEIDPHGCAESVRQAVRERWLAIAQSVRNGRGRCVLAAGSDAVWDEQVADILEFYAVWVPLAGAYKDVRQAAEQALAGRKSLRDFCPWRHDRAGAPKSSLDGARVSVLASDRRGAGFRRLRIAEPEQFVPIVNVAAGAWLRLAAAKAPAELAALREACRAQGIAQIWRSLPVVGPLPFDAGVLYPSRWPALFKELVPPQENAAVARRWGEAHVRPLLRRMSGE